MSEAYNEVWRESSEVKVFQEFLRKNKSVGKHFDRNFKSDNNGEDVSFPTDSDQSNKQSDKNCDMYEMHRKNVSQIIFNFLVKEELRERRMCGDILFGPYYDSDSKKVIVTYKKSVDLFIDKVENLRVNETYPHLKCTGA